VTAGEMARLAKKNGCELVRHGSKHDIWRSPKTGKESQIPRHWSQELPTGTANRIKKDLGLQ